MTDQTTEQETTPATGPRLSDEQIKAIYAWVRSSGQERYRRQGADFSEADYLAGVMTVFFALDCQDRIQGGWVFGPLAGRSLFGPDTPDRRWGRGRLLALADEVRGILEADRGHLSSHRLGYLVDKLREALALPERDGE